MQCASSDNSAIVIELGQLERHKRQENEHICSQTHSNAEQLLYFPESAPHFPSFKKRTLSVIVIFIVTLREMKAVDEGKCVCKTQKVVLEFHRFTT